MHKILDMELTHDFGKKIVDGVFGEDAVEELVTVYTADYTGAPVANPQIIFLPGKSDTYLKFPSGVKLKISTQDEGVFIERVNI